MHDPLLFDSYSVSKVLWRHAVHEFTRNFRVKDVWPSRFGYICYPHHPKTNNIPRDHLGHWTMNNSGCWASKGGILIR